jgi:hypothetical protein
MYEHYLAYYSRRKDFLSSAITPSLPVALNKLINDFLQYDEEDFKNAITSFADGAPDQIALAHGIAKWAIEQAGRLIHLGQGNIYQDILKSEGQTFAIRDYIKDTIPLIKKDQSLMQTLSQKTTADGGIIDTLLRSMLAIRHGAGNCHEFTAVALQSLFMLKNALGNEFSNVIGDIIVKTVRTSPTDQHIFIELSLKGKNAQQILICDPWSRFEGTLNDAAPLTLLNQSAKEVYSASGKVIFNAEEINKMMNIAIKHDLNVFSLLQKFNSDIIPEDKAIQGLFHWLKRPVSEESLAKGKIKIEELSQNSGNNNNIYKDPILTPTPAPSLINGATPEVNAPKPSISDGLAAKK